VNPTTPVGFLVLVSNPIKLSAEGSSSSSRGDLGRPGVNGNTNVSGSAEDGAGAFAYGDEAYGNAEVESFVGTEGTETGDGDVDADDSYANADMESFAKLQLAQEQQSSSSGGGGGSPYINDGDGNAYPSMEGGGYVHDAAYAMETVSEYTSNPAAAVASATLVGGLVQESYQMATAGSALVGGAAAAEGQESYQMATAGSALVGGAAAAEGQASYLMASADPTTAASQGRSRTVASQGRSRAAEQQRALDLVLQIERQLSGAAAAAVADGDTAGGEEGESYFMASSTSSSTLGPTVPMYTILPCVFSLSFSFGGEPGY
jgi:hypothetical protein